MVWLGMLSIGFPVFEISLNVMYIFCLRVNAHELIAIVKLPSFFFNVKRFLQENHIQSISFIGVNSLI